MKGMGLIGILITAAIGMSIYMYTLKQAAPGTGMVATQTADVVGVKNDLVSIAQAERMYFAQNGSYADVPTLMTTGTMNLARTSRDGYTYTATPSGNTFSVTAVYTAPPAPNPAGVTPPHFPTFTIDQNMEVHQGD
jgi:hypothetical protein